MRRLLILLLLIQFSCDNENNEADPLVTKLANTTWSVDKVELIENEIVVRTLYPNPNLQNKQKISFNEKGSVSLYVVGGSSGCGQWTVNNSKLHFVISYGVIVPGICAKNNFLNVFIANDKIDLSSDNTLIIDGIGGTFDQFHYLTDWHAIHNEVSQEKINMRTYFNKVDSDTQPQPFCCGQLNWF